LLLLLLLLLSGPGTSSWPQLAGIAGQAVLAFRSTCCFSGEKAAWIDAGTSIYLENAAIVTISRWSGCFPSVVAAAGEKKSRVTFLRSDSMLELQLPPQTAPQDGALSAVASDRGDARL